MPQIWHVPCKSSTDPNRREGVFCRSRLHPYCYCYADFRPHFLTAHSAAHLVRPTGLVGQVIPRPENKLLVQALGFGNMILLFTSASP